MPRKLQSHQRESHGPKNTTSIPSNATKHGLPAVGVTELDDAEAYSTMLSDLIGEKNPVGPMEMFLVKSAVLEMVRWPRATRLEAEYLTSELNPPIHQPELCDLLMDGQVFDPGLPAAISSKAVQQLVTLQRYESTFANRLFRTLHELERSRRMRQGERLPAPASVDVSVHTETGIAESVDDDAGTVDSLQQNWGGRKLCPARRTESPITKRTQQPLCFQSRGSETEPLRLEVGTVRLVTRKASSLATLLHN